MSATREYRGRAFGFSSRLLSPRGMLGQAAEQDASSVVKRFLRFSAFRMLKLIPHCNTE
jgi:hypothetical protein